MSKKRYRYDAKGRYKGYTSDTRQYSIKDLWWISILVLVGAVFNSVVGDKGEGKPEIDAPAEVVQNGAEVQKGEPTESRGSLVSSPADHHQIDSESADSEVSSVTEPVSAVDYVVPTQPKVENPSSFERDLKPYFEKECANGDKSACVALAQGRGG